MTPGPTPQTTVRRRLANKEVLVIALVVVGIGFILLYLGGRTDIWDEKAGAQSLVNQVGGLFVVSGGIGLLWEWRGKRAFAEEVLEGAQLSADLVNAGLVRLTHYYLRDVDWAVYFRKSIKLDVFFAYGRTWRRTHLEQLRSLAQRNEARIRVVLPDPDDEPTMDRLAFRFNMDVGELKGAVREARNDFLDLRQFGPAEITVSYRAGDPTFSYYRFDDSAIITLYSHTRQRLGVPTLVCDRGGTLYDFFRDEFEALMTQSRDSEGK